MSKKDEMNVLMESAIVLAVTTTQLEIQQEAPCVERLAISRAKLSALARVTAKEMMTVEHYDTDSVLLYLPQGAGLHFLSELQEELRRLYRHNE